MNIHCFQHVSFEGLGCIEKWITKNNHNLTITKWYENAILPDIKNIDFLIIMGGPMGVYDETEFPWLASEKEFIKKAIEAKKIILGVCLGAQLIADVLGSKVYPNKQKEIGWFPVNFKAPLPPKGGNLVSPPLGGKGALHVFHWHGDTFDIPKGATLHSSSIACKNQLFTFNENVMGIQFHLEATIESIKLFIENGRNELVPNKEFIQSEKQILQTTKYIKKSNEMMIDILEKLTK
jgi:GMP synthase-like glutamine amidotransferase